MGRVSDISNSTAEELVDYLDYLGWNANPFLGQPSLNEYVLPSPEDIADIASAIQNYTGPLLIHSRYSGAGKTTLLNVVLDEFSEDHESLYVGEHNVTPYELVSIVADGLGIGKSSSTKLTEQKIKDADIEEDVLIGIDEFGLNDPDTLHVVQFLNDNGFKVVLTGMTSQWNAIGNLGSDGRAFQRRVSYKLELEEFDLEQTKELYRRRVATVSDQYDIEEYETIPLRPFESETLRTIHKRSEGIPAVIVAACNTLLGLAAYRHSQSVGSDVPPDLAADIDYADPKADTA